MYYSNNIDIGTCGACPRPVPCGTCANVVYMTAGRKEEGVWRLKGFPSNRRLVCVNITARYVYNTIICWVPFRV